MNSLPRNAVKRSQYPEEFKFDAVRLSQERGVKVAAEDLGLNASLLSKWRKRYLTTSHSSSDKSRSYADIAKENAHLKAEVKMLENIISVLKKSTAILSQAHMEKNIK